MGLTLFDTMQGKKIEFQPAEPGVVRMYNCGPTVYNYAHIGNFRSFMLGDVLRRHLEFLGFKVHQIMNITDVGHLTQDDIDEGEDKIEKAAREKKVDPFEIVEFFTSAFMEDMEVLNMKKADSYPRATQHIPEMIQSIQVLIEKGHAYEVDGEVYFSVGSFPRYGKLSGNTLENLEAGSRVDVDPKKRHPHDFALWKKDEKHLMQWDSPFGRGFPGWHVECSSMSMKYLGSTLDIHTGGEDNIFPHHECEIAQAEGETGKTFSRTWVHARHLMVDGEKMSKSKGNFYTLRDLLEKGYDGLTVRYVLLSTQYRQQSNLSLELLDAAGKARGRLNDFMGRMGDVSAGEDKTEEVSDLATKAREDFTSALNDDLNVSGALGVIHNFCRDVNRAKPGKGGAQIAVELMRDLDQVLGILDPEEVGGKSLDDHVSQLVAEREHARKGKDFARADAIRDELKEMGIEIMDTPEGIRWKQV